MKQSLAQIHTVPSIQTRLEPQSLYYQSLTNRAAVGSEDVCLQIASCFMFSFVFHENYSLFILKFLTSCYSVLCHNHNGRSWAHVLCWSLKTHMLFGSWRRSETAVTITVTHNNNSSTNGKRPLQEIVLLSWWYRTARKTHSTTNLQPEVGGVGFLTYTMMTEIFNKKCWWGNL